MNTNFKLKTKTIFTFLLVLFFCFSLKAQDIVGKWAGNIVVNGHTLYLIFNITSADNQNYQASLSVPAQSLKDSPAKITLSDQTVNIEMPNLFAKFSGTLKEGKIEGTFNQGNYSFDLTLEKSKRPQEPIPPFDHHTEEVKFENKEANAILAGTLSMPQKEGKFPAVILISGSGLQNRDSEIFDHKPFLLIADYFTKNGIAVLRFDDRGFGESTGDFKNATTHDFATDVESGIEFLKNRKEIDNTKIGLVGHSEGGIIAAMIAARSNDVSFIISIAGSGLRGDEVLLRQSKKFLELSGATESAIQQAAQINRSCYDCVLNFDDDEKLKEELIEAVNKHISDVPDSMKENIRNNTINQLLIPWTKFFIRHDPAKDYEKIKCPVLAINGEKDFQVLAQENLAAIGKALEKGNNQNYKIIEFPNLNHLFQECETGLIQEYSVIEQTMSPVVLETMLDWIKEQTR